MSSKGTIQGREAFIGNIAGRLGRPAPMTAPPEHPFRGVPEHYAAINLDRQDKIELFIRNWTALSGKVLVVQEQEAAQAIQAYLLEVIAEHSVEGVVRWEHERLEALGLDAALEQAGVRVVPWREDGAEAGSAAAEAPHGSADAADAKAADAVAGVGQAAEARTGADRPAGGASGAASAAGAPGAGVAQAVEAAAQAAGGSNWAQRSPLLRAAEQCRLGLVWPDYAVANTSTLALLARGGRGRSVSLVTDILFAVFRADQLVTRMGEAFAYVRSLYPEAADMPSSVNLITGPSRSADIENDLTIGIHGPGKVYAVIIE